MPNKPPLNRPDYFLLSKLWSIGGTIVGLTLLGWWLDHKFHTSYIWTLAGAGLGVLYCFYEAWRELKN